MGKAKKEEAAHLESKKRKRNKVTYNYKDDIGNASSAEESAAESAAEINSNEDSSSDDNFLLPEDYLREPTKWGGTNKSPGKDDPDESTQPGKSNGTTAPRLQALKTVVSWERTDVEAVVTHLLKYGYHNEASLKVAQTAYTQNVVSHPPAEVSSIFEIFHISPITFIHIFA